jgi:tRNA nucleotidyltransferase (CCA-adding enzyme)
MSTRHINSPEFKALLTPALMKLGKIYNDNGHELRIVGGAVRDLLISKNPKDIDLATDATPAESIAILTDMDIEWANKLYDMFGTSDESTDKRDLEDALASVANRTGIRILPTGLKHGTFTAVLNGEDFEITTLRIDTEQDGRHADVSWTRDWKTDSDRRDLTMNAMSLDFDGRLYDYHGGEGDLKAGTAKFVGDADSRMIEDYLRILRYFRFQGRNDTPNFNTATLAAVKRNANGMRQISGERIWSEFAKIITGNHTDKVIPYMEVTDVTQHMGMPELNMNEFNRAKQFTNNPASLLAALLHNENDVLKVAGSWKLKIEDRELARFIVIMRDQDITMDEAMKMYTNSKIKDEYIVELLKYQGKQDLADNLGSNTKPVFPVSGKDLLAKGLPSGPNIGAILKRLENVWKADGYQEGEGERRRLLGKI